MQDYLDLLKDVHENGTDRVGRNGTTRSLFTRTFSANLQEGFPLLTTKKVYFSSVVAELLWFLRMRNRANVHDLQELGSHIWDANANADYWLNRGKTQFDGDLGRVYGVQWRSWQRSDGTTVDQLNDVIERIKADPSDRRLVVTAWNPGELDDMALPPCHMFFQFYVADGGLSLTMYQRSCDLFLGVPFNIASYALLLSMVAHVTELAPDRLNLILGDVHIYHDHLDAVNEQLEREPRRLPWLWLNPEISDIDSFGVEDIKIEDYDPHPAIKAKMSV